MMSSKPDWAKGLDGDTWNLILRHQYWQAEATHKWAEWRGAWNTGTLARAKDVAKLAVEHLSDKNVRDCIASHAVYENSAEPKNFILFAADWTPLVYEKGSIVEDFDERFDTTLGDKRLYVMVSGKYRFAEGCLVYSAYVANERTWLRTSLFVGLALALGLMAFKLASRKR